MVCAAEKTSGKELRQPKQLPAPNGDFYDVTELLNPEELVTLNLVPAFPKEKAAPVINKYRGRRRLSVGIAAGVSQAEHRRLATRGLGLLRRKPAASMLQNNLVSVARPRSRGCPMPCTNYSPHRLWPLPQSDFTMAASVGNSKMSLIRKCQFCFRRS
jgi:hypothetical protein